MNDLPPCTCTFRASDGSIMDPCPQHERAIEIIVAREREACARVADEASTKLVDGYGAQIVATAIRALPPGRSNLT